jgi:hypothetical protein
MMNIYSQPSHAARVALIALMFAMVCGLARASEVNMWFDETGEAHYSDMPRTGVEAPLAERRQKMIEDCAQNNGVDCEREVDTELRAGAIEHGGHVIHEVRRMGGPKP